MALALLAFAFAGLAFWMARQFWAAVGATRGWPTVPGRILERGVGEPMKSQGRYHVPKVVYEYEVAGRRYTNDLVYAVRRTGVRTEAVRQWVDALPDPVPVRYDPADPSRSYLVANPMNTFWLLIAMGVLTLAVGLGALAANLLGTGGSPPPPLATHAPSAGTAPASAAADR